MNTNRRNQKQKAEEEKRKIKQLRQDMEEELLKQYETNEKSTAPAVTGGEIDTTSSLDPETAKRVIEALLFASGKPLTSVEIRKVLKSMKPSEIDEVIGELSAEYEQNGRSFRIQPIAGGWELSTDRKFAPWILKLEQQKRAKQATQSALETLAIIAYKQPLSRADVEDLRGVDCAGVLTTLVERGLIKIVGRKEVPGRPFVYGTTEKFLDHFGLADLGQLPNIQDIKQLVESSVRREDLLKSDKPVEVANEAASPEAEVTGAEASNEQNEPPVSVAAGEVREES